MISAFLSRSSADAACAPSFAPCVALYLATSQEISAEKTRAKMGIAKSLANLYTLTAPSVMIAPSRGLRSQRSTSKEIGTSSLTCGAERDLKINWNARRCGATVEVHRFACPATVSPAGVVPAISSRSLRRTASANWPSFSAVTTKLAGPPMIRSANAASRS